MRKANRWSVAMSRWQVASGKWQVYQAVGMVPGGETRVRWWARPIASAMLLLLLASAASAAPAAAPDWPSHRGDIDRAAEQLEQALLAGYRGDLMGSFGNYRTFGNPSAATEDCARRILALYRMGKLSVHSDAVKRAFVLLFLKAHGDPTRHHEMIELYERIAVPNSDDPFWRIIRARCARHLGLREWLQLYEQVAKEMTGVPPDDEVRQLWAPNRAEFELNAATKRDWQKQAATFILDAAGLDATGAPPTELAELRAVQEAGYRKATAGSAGSAPALELFRRYRWSESAQRKLMESARQHLFAGETQAAFRCFEDVLRHAVPGALRDEAQVGLWVSLAQFAEPAVLARAFDGVNANATWPWHGKRAKTATIQGQLVPKTVARPRAPSLVSLVPKIVRLPWKGTGHSVFSVDMQRDGDRLLVSNPTMLAMYAADNPAKPLWIQNRGTGRGAARFAGQRIVTPFGEEHRVVSLRRADGTIGHEGNPNGPRTPDRYNTIGGPTLAGNRAYAVQIGLDYGRIYGHPQARGNGYVALSCFGSNLEHLWTRCTRQYRSMKVTTRSSALRPRVSQGAVFFCLSESVLNQKQERPFYNIIIRADCRDGEMEWSRSVERVNAAASPWCFGGEPVVTGNAVVCLPKVSGSLFAVDKETGRRRWTLTYPWAYEMLGRHEDQVVLTGPNTVYALDVHTGKMRWGRQISPVWCLGFQLPHAQLIGDSVYCGTKNELFRFDARTGAKLE